MLFSQIDMGLAACCGVFDMNGMLIQSTSSYQKLLGAEDSKSLIGRKLIGRKTSINKAFLKSLVSREKSVRVWVLERNGLSPQIVESEFSLLQASSSLQILEIAKPQMMNVISRNSISERESAYQAIAYILSDLIYIADRWGFSNTKTFLRSVKTNIS